MGEAYIRLVLQERYLTPEMVRNRSLRYVPSLFSRHVFPPKEVLAQGLRNRTYYINKKGYRGPNFSIAKPKGAVRIIFYGGSGVFDSPAFQGQDWPHRVERLLRQAGFPRVEVINAGIPGHASFDSLGRLFAEGHFFEPDYVVLYNAWNDIKYFRFHEPLLRQLKPYQEENDPRLNYQGALDRWLCRFSRLYLRLRHAYYTWRLHVGPEGRNPRGELKAEISRRALRQYKLNLEMFVDLARNIGAVPVLMTQARLVRSDNTPQERRRIGYQSQGLTHPALCWAFEQTDKIIRQVGAEKNVAVIDASGRLTGKDEYFWDHIHLSEKGSRAVARLTAEAMAEMLRGRGLVSEAAERR